MVSASPENSVGHPISALSLSSKYHCENHRHRGTPVLTRLTLLQGRHVAEFHDDIGKAYSRCHTSNATHIFTFYFWNT